MISPPLARKFNYIFLKVLWIDRYINESVSIETLKLRYRSHTTLVYDRYIRNANAYHFWQVLKLHFRLINSISQYNTSATFSQVAPWYKTREIIASMQFLTLFKAYRRHSTKRAQLIFLPEGKSQMTVFGIGHCYHWTFFMRTAKYPR